MEILFQIDELTYFSVVTGAEMSQVGSGRNSGVRIPSPGIVSGRQAGGSDQFLHLFTHQIVDLETDRHSLLQIEWNSDTVVEGIRIGEHQDSGSGILSRGVQREPSGLVADCFCVFISHDDSGFQIDFGWSLG